MEITWEKAGEDYLDLEENINPFTDESEGMRIFPGKKDPNDSIRNKVKLKVDIGVPNLEVYVKAFDVDDPTPTDFDDEHLIDPNDSTTEGKGGDNRPNWQAYAPQSLIFTSSGSDTAHKASDSNGVAEFEFNVGMQPGHNYRVAVSIDDDSGFSGVQVNDPSADGYLGPKEHQATVPASPLLTVWRRLNIEVDTMEKWSGTKLEPDRTIAEGASWTSATSTSRWSTLTLASDLPEGEENFYQGGYIQSGNFKLNISSNTASTIKVDHPAGPTPLTGAEKEAFILTEFVVRDDDDRDSDDNFDLIELLPQNDVINDEVKRMYADAYIAIEAVPQTANFNANPTIPFEANAPPSWTIGGGTVLNDSQDMAGSDELGYWYILLSVAYQPGESVDSDPIGAALMGVTETKDNSFVANLASVYVEVIREQAFLATAAGQSVAHEFSELLNRVVAHEIGHGPSHGGDSDHDEGGIMSDGASGETFFTPATIDRFRSTKEWENYQSQ